ncbi:MAG: NFACT RNA binding domain-containing protein [bacterium]|nr:NFACT RNA binding domain-containing protein [bacterium]
MYLDAFTISALVDEFLDTLVGGKIQDAIDVDETGLGFEVYAHHRRRYLYLSADQAVPRVHVVPDKLRRGTQRPMQIGLLVRRYVEGGTLTHVSQPPWERVIHFEIDGPEGVVEIVVEPMERRSNILLVQGGVILDVMRRVGPEENRVRLSLPNHAYVPPPLQTGKRNPFEITVEDMVGFFQQTHDPKQKTYQVLSVHLLGMSPLLAKEIVYRSEGEAGLKQKASAADPDGLFEAMKKLIEPLKRREWQPGIVQNEDEDEEGATAYSVYPIQHLPGWKPIESVSAALTAFYGAPTGEDAYRAAKLPVRKIIQEAQAKLRAKLNSLERSMTDDEEREVLRQSGELILAYQYGLQKDQTELRAQYDLDKPELVIRLDPTLTPLENAQRYFNRYNKAKKALDDVPQLIEETRNRLAYLDQLATDLETASNWPDIDDVMAELSSSGYYQGKRAKRLGGAGQSAPIRIVTPDAYVMWVGRNSRQNEIVTFKRGGGDDLWLHARDVPGAHVVIKFDGRAIPDRIIDQAAAMAAYYSARRTDGKVPVDVTRVKYVRKIKGGGQGMVTYRNEETRMVAPRSEKSLEQD